MKSYPITDHVPEHELRAITSAGARRWLEQRGWHGIPCPERGWWYVEQGPRFGDDASPTALVPGDGVRDYALRVAQMIEEVARVTRVPAGAVLVAMQADSRIAAECARLAAKKTQTVQQD